MTEGKTKRASRWERGITALALTGAVPAVLGAQRPVTPLVFDGVTVVDVEQGKLVPDQRVVVTGNRIEAVGNTNAIDLSKDARIVQARGKYLIPGLWDMHVHMLTPADRYYHLLLVATGITGMRDAFSNMPIDTLLRWRKEILAGTRVGPPRQLIAGRKLNTTNPESAQKQVEALKAAGATFLKMYPFSFALAAAARRAGIPFGGHVQYGRGAKVTAIEGSDSGISIMDHVQAAGDLDQRCLASQASVEQCRPVAERFRQNNTWWTPTLIRRIKFSAFGKPQLSPGRASDAVGSRLVEVADQFVAGSVPKGKWLRGIERVGDADSLRFLSIVQRVGLPMLAGSDVGPWVAPRELPGFALHAELAIFVTEGVTPLEALRAATLNPAKLLRATDSLGTVAPGKLADLVLLDADPMADITNTTAIRAVVANGRYFDRGALDRLLTEAQLAIGQKKEPMPMPIPWKTGPPGP